MKTRLKEKLTNKPAEKALRESEEKYSNIYEQSPIGIVFCDSSGHLLEANRTCLDIFGVSDVKKIRRFKLFDDLNVPDDAKGRLHKGQTISYETLLDFKKVTQRKSYKTTKSGGVYLDMLITPLNGKGKESPSGYLIQLRDITKRKQVEEALRRERDNFIRILEAMEDGVCIINQQYDIIYLNLALETQFGPPEGRKCYEYFNDRKGTCPWCRKQDVIAGRTVRWEWHSLKNQKTYDLIETPLRNPDGSISKLAIFRDITERKQTEVRFKTLSHNSPISIYIVQEGRFQYANPQFEKLTGYSQNELMGTMSLDYLPAKDRETVRTNAIQMLKGQSSSPYEYELVNKTGQVRRVMETVTSIQYQEERATLANCIDITELKQLEEEMIKYEELNKLKNNLLSTVSHELRTPLATIKGYSTMLLDYNRRLKKDEKRQYLQSVDSATDRLTELIDHLLDMSRLDAGLLKLEKAPAKIASLLEKTVAEGQLRHPRHTIVLDARRKIPLVNIDVRRIRQVLDNLIDNACKYSEEETEVVVSAQMTNRELIISVADQGMGIAAEELERVFDHMYRVEQRLTTRAGGMGLGLGICKGLVEAHGGRIWVESEEGKGSIFFFTIPVKTPREPYGEKPNKDNSCHRG